MLLLSSDRKYPHFPLFSYFPWLCAWDVCYIISSHLLYIHSGKTGNLFSLVLCSLWWVQIVGYVLLADRISLFVHYTIIIVQTLSEDIELIKCLSDIICRVWVRLSIFSQLSIIQYVGLCVVSLPISLWWLGEYIYFVLLSLSNRKYELLPVV